MRVIAVIFAILISLCIFSVSVFAVDIKAEPSKESLLLAWETVQKENPATVKFEKIGTGVYDFETTIFPYKGKLRVVNLLINKKPSAYYDDLQDYRFDEAEEDLTGIVELTLDGVDEKFQEKFRVSYKTWDRDNALHYNAATQTWYAPAKWADVRDALKTPTSAPVAKTPKDEKPTFFGVFLSWVPMILLIAVWLFLCRGQKAVQNRAIQLCEQTLVVQKEILEVLKKKT